MKMRQVVTPLSPILLEDKFYLKRKSVLFGRKMRFYPSPSDISQVVVKVRALLHSPTKVKEAIFLNVSQCCQILQTKKRRNGFQKLPKRPTGVLIFNVVLMIFHIIFDVMTFFLVVEDIWNSIFVSDLRLRENCQETLKKDKIDSERPKQAAVPRRVRAASKIA